MPISHLLIRLWTSGWAEEQPNNLQFKLDAFRAFVGVKTNVSFSASGLSSSYKKTPGDYSLSNDDDDQSDNGLSWIMALNMFDENINQAKGMEIQHPA